MIDSCQLEESTILYRQIHPTQIKENRITSNAFRPSKNHDEKLSTYHGDMLTSEESYNHYTSPPLNKESAGVKGISVGECQEANKEIIVEHDKQNFEEHVSVDFSKISSNGQKKKAAKYLCNKAVERDWLYQP